MIKKRKKKTWKHKYRAPKNVDWNSFVVEWNNLYHAGADLARAAQLFGLTRSALTNRRCVLAKFGIFLPELAGMEGFRNRRWQKASQRVCKPAPKPMAAPRMLADMASAGAVFALVPVKAG